MVETAFHAKKDKNLIFVVVGNGQTKQDLIKKCMKLELDNVKFYSSVVKNEVPFILQSIDILFNAMHFKELYSYGTSPIKIPEYIQSKKPIINVTNSFSLLDELDCWETIRKYDPSEVIKSIYKLKNLKPDEKKAIGEKAKLLLEKKYNYNYLSNSLLMFIESTKK